MILMAWGLALEDRVAAMYAAGADIAKVAVMARDASDLAIIEELIADQEQSIIALAMGEAGLPSRLLAGAWGLLPPSVA